MRYSIFPLSILWACVACNTHKQKDALPQPVTPLAKPVAAFDLGPSARAYAPVQPVSRSQNATAYAWDWGDGTISATEAATHQYGQIGSYRIRLQVTNATGTDSISQVVRVGYGGPPAGLAQRIAGLYRGRLSYGNNYPPGPYPPKEPWQRDTILQVTFVNDSTLQMMGSNMRFSTSNVRGGYPWLAGANRPHYQFDDGLITKNYNVLQTEHLGDSIVFSRRQGGVSTAEIYLFIGKKQ